MYYLTLITLLKTNLNIYIIVGGIVLFIFLFVVRKVIEITSEKLDNEDEKITFLKTKFKNEIEVLKSDEISAEIVVDKPYRKNKPWKVYKVTDRGYQGSNFKTQYKSTHLLDISDSDLEKLIE